MTGRKGRVVRRPDGSVRYESRAEQGLTIDHINIKEKDRFMSAEKVSNTWKMNCRKQSLSACCKASWTSLYHVSTDDLFCSSLWPSSQKQPALGFPCRQTNEWKTRDEESTWPWSCLGVQTEPFSNSVSQEMRSYNDPFKGKAESVLGNKIINVVNTSGLSYLQQSAFIPYTGNNVRSKGNRNV